MEEKGTNALTNVMMHMMKSVADKPPVLDFGVINSDYSLSINTFAQAIPKEDYSVCRSVLYDPSVPLTETYLDGGHDHKGAVPYETHQHEVRLPLKMRWLKPGDKVIVAVIQNEFIVLDMVFNASYLGRKEPDWS